MRGLGEGGNINWFKPGKRGEIFRINFIMNMYERLKYSINEILHCVPKRDSVGE